VLFVRGKGTRLWDPDGKEYLENNDGEKAGLSGTEFSATLWININTVPDRAGSDGAEAGAQPALPTASPVETKELSLKQSLPLTINIPEAAIAPINSNGR
jgi:hypothetical protein